MRSAYNAACERIADLEAQCAALRQAVIGCKPLVCAAWKSPDRFYCVAYTETDGISPHLLEEDHLDYYMLKKELEKALSSDAGSALLKRLQAAEAVCEALPDEDTPMNETWRLHAAWRQAKGE